MQAKLTTNFPLGADHLAVVGPLVEVVIHWDEAFYNGGRDGPEKSVTGWALIDTGAAESAISAATADILALPAGGRDMAMGFAGLAEHERRSAFIRLAALETTQHGQFLVSDALAETPHLVAILGRGFLRHFRLIYDGRTGEVVLENGKAGTAAKVVTMPSGRADAQ